MGGIQREREREGERGYIRDVCRKDGEPMRRQRNQQILMSGLDLVMTFDQLVTGGGVWWKAGAFFHLVVCPSAFKHNSYHCFFL